MSDRFGLLQLPAATPSGDPNTTAIGDPLLDTLLAFLQAAINADTKRLWARVHPAIIPPATEPVPVLKVFAHNPDEGMFSTKTLPALYAWRQSSPRNFQLTQEWQEQDSVLGLLWVPPLARVIEHSRIRQAFRHAIAKSLARAITNEKHPAWIAPGDTSPAAQDYGSFLLPRIGVAKIDLIDVKPYDLVTGDESKNEPYDAVLATIEVRELLVPLNDDFDPIEDVRGTLSLGVGGDALAVNNFQFRPTLLAAEPASGSADGDTAATILGRQFPVGLDDGVTPTVLFGDAPATDVVVTNEGELTLRTPPHAQGTVDVTVILPSGATATLANAYTFTSSDAP